MDPLLVVDKSKKSHKILVIVVGAVSGVAIVALLVWYFVSVRPARKEVAGVAQQVQQQLEEQQKIAEAVDTVVSPPALSVEGVAPPTNPVEARLPEVNPVERANPFAQESVNPFE